MKIKRHNKILEIIEHYNIETQEELIDKLRLAGYDVTQATISRDIRELKLLKVMSETGTYKYVVPGGGQHDHKHIYSKAIDGSIRSVDYAMNNIVIKTYPGMANAVAARIDSFHEKEILGSVAGDDCIIMVTKTVESAQILTEKFKELIG
jgi:transcriptional regulator of arginine metabolism